MAFLEDVAAIVGDEFSVELEGRSYAVSDAEITEQNVPTLPVAMVALNVETAQHAWQGNSSPTIQDDFLIEFWLKNERYRKEDESESPFWAFYDYEAIRDKLLNRLIEESHKREDWGIQYVSMDLNVNPYSIILTFRLNRNYKWCRPDVEGDEPKPYKVLLKLCPAEDICDPCEQEKESCDEACKS